MASHRYTLKPTVPDLRDKVWGAPQSFRTDLNVDLGVRSGVKDQGQEGSCTGFSTSTAREMRNLVTGGQPVELSPAFLYYETRNIEGQINQDAGSDIRDDMKVLLHEGVCPESFMPYRAGDYRTAPGADAYAHAAAAKITAYWRVTRTKRAIAYAFTEKQPMVIGIAVYQSFESVGGDGKVPIPRPGEAMLGGHALALVGCTHEGVLGQNSWGASGWGASGMFTLPWAYIMAPQLTFDLFTFS